MGRHGGGHPSGRGRTDGAASGGRTGGAGRVRDPGGRLSGDGGGPAGGRTAVRTVGRARGEARAGLTGGVPPPPGVISMARPLTGRRVIRLERDKERLSRDGTYPRAS